MFTVRDIMTKQVVTVDPDAPVEEAIDLMLQHRVSGLPVVASCGQLLGVVTEFDIIGVFSDPDTERSKVYHFMTRDPEVVTARSCVYELAEKFQARPIRRYPVTEGGQLVGIVSRRDLIRLVRKTRAAVHHQQDTILV